MIYNFSTLGDHSFTVKIYISLFWEESEIKVIMKRSVFIARLCNTRTLDENWSIFQTAIAL